MTRRAQRGILLLPVALTLALIGTLAYSLTREGSMQVSAVDAEYDMEVARYLTESGLHLAKWQNEKAGCSREVSFGTVDLPGGRLVAKTIDRRGKNELRVSLSATTTRGTVRSLTAQETTVYDLTEVREITLKTADGSDTTIVEGASANLGTADNLALTDDKSRALLKFAPLPGELDYASVLSAQLLLVLFDSNSTQAGRFLSAHRVTRDWGAAPTWTSPWTSGRDYFAPEASARADIGDARPKEYVLAIGPLVDAWANKTIENHGVLLKSGGLLNDRFHSLEATTVGNRPKLVVRYHPRC